MNKYQSSLAVIVKPFLAAKKNHDQPGKYAGDDDGRNENEQVKHGILQKKKGGTLRRPQMKISAASS